MEKGRVLVTGAGGFNGRYILELLKENGYTPRATDLAAGERTAQPEYYEKLGVEFIASDLTDPATLGPVVADVECIMHVASLFDYSATLEEDRKINVEGMRNLCNAAKAAGVKRMILWGTVGVYGVQQDPRVTEDAPPNPGNAYEISKYEQEVMALECSRRGDFEVVVIRPAPVYGPGNRYGFINLIKMHNLLPHIPVLAGMKTRMPAVHVKDVARAGLFLMEQPAGAVDGQVFNMVDDSNIPLPDFERTIAALLGKETIKIGIPIYMPVFLQLGRFGAAVSKFISDKLLGGKRPLIEDATIYYIQFDYQYSNEKIKSIGFKFAYPDVRVGLIEMIDWIKAENMEPIKVF